MTSPARIKFLNVDLDLESRTDLKPLVEALGAKVFVLHARKARGTYFVSLELAGRLAVASNRPTADKCILAFSKLIELLPPLARRAWDRASRRRFDIGVQASLGAAGPAFLEHLRASTVRRVADLNGELTLTVYPAE